ncbi:MAG TPA: alpha/beta hydrolase [Syntrophorhabdales bacterium]|nr:alpha/beta hydrolase [Syntrophorhabdales bacterium]
MPDYTPVDVSHLLSYIFYPRQDFTSPPANAFDLLVPVEPGVNVSCRFYIGEEHWPLILYFHGNGEVVSDYDHIAPLYNRKALNLVVSDYRGYGASGGSPTLGAISRDCHVIFKAVKEEISQRRLRGGLWVMGRSLGSISATELACRWKNKFRALIIESGFVSILPVMKHIGLSLQMDDVADRIMEEALAMVRNITLPTLIIHGEEDTLVPVEEARRFYDNLGSAEKKLLIIPGADHNDIMFAGMDQYFEAIQAFIASTLQT